jgi:hypothetical protein
MHVRKQLGRERNPPLTQLSGGMTYRLCGSVWRLKHSQHAEEGSWTLSLAN